MEDSENNEGKSGFGLPEGYFQSSAARLRDSVEWLEEHKEFPILLENNRKTGFSVPEYYFKNNEFILELGAYPALEKINRTNPFNVPAGYFPNSAKKLA